jgi:metal-sulfur cluster biosynthetic enzyme
MNEESKIAVEEIEAAPPPPARPRVDREPDYLEGFLGHKPQPVPAGEPGGEIYEAVIATLKEIYDPEIPVNIYDLGLIYGVDVTGDGHVVVTMTLTTPHCPVAESMPGEIEMQVGAVPGVGVAEVNLGSAVGSAEDV